MYPIYRDIRSKLGAPIWHDENGVPRYDEFNPKLLGIYDDYAAYFLVECQSCRKHFPCAIGKSKYVFESNEMKTIENMNQFIDEYIMWGDAPWHDDDQQCAGTTMGSSVVKLLSVWERKDVDWEELEVTQSMTDLVAD